MRNFARKYHHSFQLAAIAAWTVTLALWVMGCGLPQWISQINQIIPIASAIAAAIIQFISILGGQTISAEAMATLTKVTSEVQGGLASVQQMVNEYNATPSTTLLGSIQVAVQSVIDNITTFLTNTGITDTATQSKILALFQLILAEVTALQSLLPVITASAGDKVTIIVPMSSDEAKAAYNAILDGPSGNPVVDAALAKLKRM